MDTNSVRVLLALSLCFVLPQYPALAQVKARPNAAVNQIRNMKTAVVQIRYKSDASSAHPPGPVARPDEGTRAGTGFFVSAQGYVLTAGHVIRGAQGVARAAGASNIEFEAGILLDPSSVPGLSFQGSFLWVGATVVDVDDVHDLALLKLSKNPFTGEVQTRMVVRGAALPLKVTTARLGSRLPSEGENLLVSGYPLRIPTLVTQTGMVASRSFVMVEVPQSRGPVVLNRPEAADSILFDAVVNPGNSGGPVYDSQSGEVLGICEAYEQSPLLTSNQHNIEVRPGEFLTQNSGLAVVIPIDYGIKLLRKNGVSDFSTKRPR